MANNSIYDISTETLKRQLNLLYNSYDIHLKQQANDWLLSFQQHRVSWCICKEALYCFDEPLLQYVGAQTLAYKAKFTSDQLSLSEKQQFIEFLFEFFSKYEQLEENRVNPLESITEQGINSHLYTSQNNTNFSKISLTLLEKLAECLANLLLHCLVDWNNAIPTLLRFGENKYTTNTFNSFSNPSPFSFSSLSKRWLTIFTLLKFPEGLEQMHLPSKQDLHKDQLQACQEMLPSIQQFVSISLSVCLDGINNIAALPHQGKIFIEKCIYSIFEFLLNWMNFFPKIRFLKDINISSPLTRIIYLQPAHPNTFDFCSSLLIYISTYMNIWKSQDDLKNLFQNPNNFNSNQNYNKNQYNEPENQYLLNLWNFSYLPNDEGERLFIDCLISQFLQVHSNLESIHRSIWGDKGIPTSLSYSSTLNSHLNNLNFDSLNLDDESLALRGIPGLSQSDSLVLMNWSHLLSIFFEGFPQCLFTSTNPSTEIQSTNALFKELFGYLWCLHPSTAQLFFSCISNFKELYREGLLPMNFLQSLLNEILGMCITAIFRHSRRNQPFWFSTHYSQNMNSASSNSVTVGSSNAAQTPGNATISSSYNDQHLLHDGSNEDRESFLIEAAEVLSDLFLLHQIAFSNLSEAHSQLLNNWMAIFPYFIETNDIDAIDIFLQFTSKLIDAYQCIPAPLFVLFSYLRNIPADPLCGKSISEFIVNITLFLDSEAISCEIWQICFNSLIKQMENAPINASKALVHLCKLSNEKFHQFHKSNPAIANETLHSFFRFVETQAPRYTIRVDTAIHASCVYLLLRLSDFNIQPSFDFFLSPIIASFQALTVELSNNKDTLNSEIEMSAFRLLHRLNGCLSAIEFVLQQLIEREPIQMNPISSEQLVTYQSMLNTQQYSSSDNFSIGSSSFSSTGFPPSLKIRLCIQNVLTKSEGFSNDTYKGFSTSIQPLWQHLIRLTYTIATQFPFLSAKTTFSSLFILPKASNSYSSYNNFSSRSTFDNSEDFDKNSTFVSILLQCLRRFACLLGLNDAALPFWQSLLQLCQSVMNTSLYQQQPVPSSLSVPSSSVYTQSIGKGSLLLLFSELMGISSNDFSNKNSGNSNEYPNMRSSSKSSQNFQRDIKSLLSCSTATSDHFLISLSEHFPHFLAFYKETLPHLPNNLLWLMFPLIKLMNSFSLNTNTHYTNNNSSISSSSSSNNNKPVSSSLFFICNPNDFNTSLQLCIYLLRSPEPQFIKTVLTTLNYIYAFVSQEDNLYTHLLHNLESLVVALFSYIPLWGLSAFSAFYNIIQTLLNSFKNKFLTLMDAFLKQPRALTTSKTLLTQQHIITNLKNSNFATPPQYIDVTDSQRSRILECFKNLQGRQKYKFLWELCNVVDGSLSLDEFLIPYT